MKILIADDEQPARERIKRLLTEIGGYEILGEATNGLEVIEQCNITQPEIILLDIRMPVMDGLEAMQHLMTHEHPPAIIFTTAYEEHAIQAFDAHAVDYLLKPIRIERLREALTNACRPTRAQRKIPYSQLVQNNDRPNTPRTHICVRRRDKLELIAIEDIYYFFAEHKYVTLRHPKGEALIEESLTGLEEELSAQFIRVHRNALVAKNKIIAMEKQPDNTQHLIFKDIPNHIEISRRHLPFVKRILTHKDPT